MESPGEPAAGSIHCIHCNRLIQGDALTCPYCGTDQILPDIDHVLQNQRQITSLTIFFGVYLLVCLFSGFTRFVRGLIPLLIVDGTLSIFTLLYVVVCWTDLKSIVRWNNFSLKKLLSYSVQAVAGAIAVNYVVRWVNKSIFDSESYYYYAFSHLKYAKLATIIVVALQPAVFEELAFRGVLQEKLNKITDTRQSIFISAFLFSLLHLSVISFFWLMPFALWLGYVRNKEQTLWYGILIHFCFNTTACFLEFFELHLI